MNDLLVQYVSTGLGTVLALYMLKRYGLPPGRDRVELRPFLIGLWVFGALMSPTIIECLWGLILWMALLLLLRTVPDDRASVFFCFLALMAVYGCFMVIFYVATGGSLTLDQVGQLLRLDVNFSYQIRVISVCLENTTGITLPSRFSDTNSIYPYLVSDGRQFIVWWIFALVVWVTYPTFYLGLIFLRRYNLTRKVAS